MHLYAYLNETLAGELFSSTRDGLNDVIVNTA